MNLQTYQQFNEQNNNTPALLKSFIPHIFKNIINDVSITLKELKNMSGEDYNKEFCDYFAEYVTEHIPGSEYMSSEDINMYQVPHAFVKIDNKYYDYETLNGVSNPTDLPIFQRYINLNN